MVFAINYGNLHQWGRISSESSSMEAFVENGETIIKEEAQSSLTE